MPDVPDVPDTFTVQGETHSLGRLPGGRPGGRLWERADCVSTCMQCIPWLSATQDCGSAIGCADTSQVKPRNALHVASQIPHAKGRALQTAERYVGAMVNPNGKKKRKRLTAKQEAFADAVATGDANTLTDAYRGAGYSHENMKPQVLWNEASKLANNPEVSVRIEERQDAIARSIEAKHAGGRTMGVETSPRGGIGP